MLMSRRPQSDDLPVLVPVGLRYRATAGAGNESDVQPPFQAISGLEVLYGGLRSLWRLPLQLSGPNDTLFSSYLAAHPLTVRQNRTLAKPRPPTPPGFGEHSIKCRLCTCATQKVT